MKLSELSPKHQVELLQLMGVSDYVPIDSKYYAAVELVDHAPPGSMIGRGGLYRVNADNGICMLVVRYELAPIQHYRKAKVDDSTVVRAVGVAHNGFVTCCAVRPGQTVSAEEAQLAFSKDRDAWYPISEADYEAYNTLMDDRLDGIRYWTGKDESDERFLFTSLDGRYASYVSANGSVGQSTPSSIKADLSSWKELTFDEFTSLKTKRSNKEPIRAEIAALRDRINELERKL